MESTLLDFLFGMFEQLGNFGIWLTSNIEGEILGFPVSLDFTPLGLFTIAGITTIVLFHVWHLVKLVF